MEKEEIVSNDELLQKTLLVAINQINEQKNEMEEQKAKIAFANLVETADTSILIGDLAKLMKQNGYEIGQNRLFCWLRENGYLIKLGQRRNLPTQKAMNLGLFEISQRIVTNAKGNTKIQRTTKVTGRGQIYFMNKLLKKGS